MRMERYLYVYIFIYCMTHLLLDADSLIKLTKAGAKELVVKHLDVSIPLRVKQECVDEAVDKPDAIRIEQNIRTQKIQVVTTDRRNMYVEKEIQKLGLKGGEQDLYRLSTQSKYDLLSSDDQKFLKLLQMLDKPAITAASVILLLYQLRKITRRKARHLLRNVQPYVSDAEFHLCLNEVECE